MSWGTAGCQHPACRNHHLLLSRAAHGGSWEKSRTWAGRRVHGEAAAALRSTAVSLTPHEPGPQPPQAGLGPGVLVLPDSTPDPWQGADTASPGCRDIPEAGQALEDALTPQHWSPGQAWDSLPGDRLPQQCPAVPCWEQLDHKPPAPDRAFAREGPSAGSAGQSFTIMVYSAKLPLLLRSSWWLLALALRAACSYSCPAGTSQAAHCWDSMGGRVGLQH